jgi:hypothetical protein
MVSSNVLEFLSKYFCVIDVGPFHSEGFSEDGNSLSRVSQFDRPWGFSKFLSSPFAIMLVRSTSASSRSANWCLFPALFNSSARANALHDVSMACFSRMYCVTCLALLEWSILEL